MSFDKNTLFAAGIIIYYCLWVVWGFRWSGKIVTKYSLPDPWLFCFGTTIALAAIGMWIFATISAIWKIGG